MTNKIIPCRYCKRSRIKVHNKNIVGSQIIADKCIHCNGRGWIRVDDKVDKIDKVDKVDKIDTSNINKLKNIENSDNNNEKGGNK